MINIENLIRDLSRVREQSPLVHNITNYVVMNNTANALLAIGASPVMAHSTEEVEDMVHIASSLVINIGTLDTPWVDAMLLAGKAANKKQIPLVFDPVGAGATSYRSQVCHKLIKECKPSIIRGNASEIIALLDGAVKTKGVDSTDPSVAALNSAKELAKQTGAIVVISGETDYITNGKEVELVKNGHPMMAKVTGMGCTATAIIAAFATINSNLLEAATHAMSVMGIAGEVAAKISAGNGSLQLNFLDTLFNLNEEIVRKNIRQ